MASALMMGRPLASQLLVPIGVGIVEVGAPAAVLVVPRAVRQHRVTSIGGVHLDQSCRSGQKRGR